MNTSPISLLNAKDISGKNKVEKVAEQFAAILVSQVFDEMQKNVLESSLIPQSQAEKWYRQWLMDIYAQESVKSSLKPLADMIASQLANNGYRK
ncbi:rod-binding protein [Mesoaciditoga sp.]